MDWQEVITPFVTHLLPIIFFTYLITDIMIRNPKSTVHQLAAGVALCALLMFTEEMVRHFLPIEYSPLLTAAWFAPAGITIVGLGLHLFVRLTHMHHRMPKWLYPHLFYLPTVVIILNLFFNDRMVSGSAFHQVGIWKLPVYNLEYYIAMIGSHLYILLYVIILQYGRMKAASKELGAIYNELTVGVIVVAFFNFFFGLVDFKGYLPPYPYIYGDVAWCILLRRTMLKYDFLNHLDKRYAKLFNMNPAAIVLYDLKGNLREVNPSARQLFESMDLTPERFFDELPEEMKARIASRQKIALAERKFPGKNGYFEVVIDCDYVEVDHTPHVIMIIRDVTRERKIQREISFLAYHDGLTGLPNRSYFMKRFHEAIQEAQRSRQHLAVVVFDMDRFKSINDKHGHLAGDQALIHMAGVLREVVETRGGVTARLGGDEFSFYLLGRPLEDVVETIRIFMRTLEDRPLKLPDTLLPLQVSIGVSLFPEHGNDSDTLLSNADKALYSVKRVSRNGFAIFSETAGP